MKNWRHRPGGRSNISLTLRNWLIGAYYISEFELHGSDRARYGDSLLTELAKRLTRLKISNCNRRQLYRYLRFYRLYPEIVGTMPPQLQTLLPTGGQAVEKVGTASPQFPSLPGLGDGLPALAAMAGHSRSIFLKFRGGGRGVATFFGGLAALIPPVALFGGEIFIIGAGLTKFVSLASIVAAVSTYAVLVPLTIFHRFPIEYLIYALAGTVVILIMHRENISRLLSGTERKLGEKAKLRS